jgi:hypothetical protein
MGLMRLVAGRVREGIHRMQERWLPSQLPCLVLAALLGLGWASSSQAEVLVPRHTFDRGGAVLQQMEANGRWHIGTSKPQPVIADTGVAAFGKAMRIFPVQSNNILRFAPQREGVVIVSFDVKLTHRDRLLTVGVARADTGSNAIHTGAASWVSWGAEPGEIRHYASGWRWLADFEPGGWHHVDLLLYLSGERAGTFDLNIDGGPAEATTVPWRNEMDLAGSPGLGMILFQGAVPTTTAAQSPQDYAAIDNVMVSHVSAASLQRQAQHDQNETR